MPTLQELIDDRIRRYEDVPESFLTAVERSQVDLWQLAIELLSGLNTSGGEFVTSVENLNAITQIIEILQRTMTDGQYGDALITFISEYNTQSSIVQEIIRASLGSFTDNALYETALNNAIDNALLLLDETAIRSELLVPIKSILDQSITTGSSFSDTVQLLKEFMISDDVNLGRYQRWASQVAFDSFAVTDRTYANTIHQDLGITKYEYLGGTVQDSRCFCIERTEKTWSKEQLEQWGRRENIGNCEISLKTGRKGWAGINDATNEKTIFNYLGGWRCGHVLIAVGDDAKTDNLSS